MQVAEVKKILLVSNTSFYLHNFRLGQMKYLRGHGYEVIGAAPEDEYSAKVEEEGFRLIRIKTLDRKGLNPFRDIILLIELYSIYKKEKPALVLHYTVKPNIYGALSASATGVRFLCTITGGGYIFIKKGLLNFIGKKLYRVALSQAERVFFQNSEDRNMFIQCGLVKAEKTLVVAGSGINTDFFSPANGSDTSKDYKIFLFLSRMLRDKGVVEFVEAAREVRRKHPSARFQLLGPIDKGNPAVIGEDVINEWQSEGVIEYLGTADDVRPFISPSDAVVLPSYREGLPRALLEAMAMERPVITTNVAGCRDVVEEGKNGFLVPVKDSGSLIDAMLSFIELPAEKRHEMGRYGRNKVLMEFDQRIVNDAYLREIKIVLRD